MDQLSRRTMLITAAAPDILLPPATDSYFADVSLDQWLALTPPELVKAHLELDDRFMQALRRDKFPVVPA